jgi:hypothetical protein
MLEDNKSAKKMQDQIIGITPAVDTNEFLTATKKAGKKF